MVMAITMRMLARILFFATEVTQRPLSSLHYTHIKRTPKSRCAICNGCEDTAKMSLHSRGTCLGDFAGDRQYKNTIPTAITIMATIGMYFVLINQTAIHGDCYKVVSEILALVLSSLFTRTLTLTRKKTKIDNLSIHSTDLFGVANLKKMCKTQKSRQSASPMEV
jgi:hypothetical protein